MRRGIHKECYCGNSFYEYPYQRGKKKFCSKKCANKANAKRNSKSKKGRNNPMFGKKPWNKGMVGIVKGIKGNKNHWWRGGRCDESRLARTTIEWKLWREKVYKRDGYKCRLCKKRGGVLVPHHIKLFRFYKRDRYKIENGVTLCRKHHRELHNKNINKKIINIYD